MHIKLFIRQAFVVATGAVFLCAAIASAGWNYGYTQSDLGMPSIFPDDPKVTMQHSIVAFHKNGKRFGKY